MVFEYSNCKILGVLIMWTLSYCFQGFKFKEKDILILTN